MPSGTVPARGIVPVASSNASTSVVLPEPEWPTTATLRSFSGRSTAAAATTAPRSAPLVDPFDAIGRLRSSVLVSRVLRFDTLRLFTDKPSDGLGGETLRSRQNAGEAGQGPRRTTAPLRWAHHDRSLLPRPVLPQRLGTGDGALIRWLVKHGVTANTVTVVGTLGAMAGALVFYSRGVFFVGTLVIWAFAMLDFVDGSVARAQGGSTVFGAVLDSTLDRVVDAAVFGALIWWFAGAGDSTPLLLACLLCLVIGSVVSYVKARAEGAGLRCDVGLIERPQRLTTVAGRHRAGRPRRAVRAGGRAVGAGRAVGVHGLAAAGRGAPARPGRCSRGERAGTGGRRSVRRRLGRGAGAAAAGRVGRVRGSR